MSSHSYEQDQDDYTDKSRGYGRILALALFLIALAASVAATR